MYTCVPGGQFVVPKKYILNRTKEEWKKALDLLSQNETWRIYSHELSWFYLFTNIGKFGTYEEEKHNLDKEKRYSFNHKLNSYQDMTLLLFYNKAFYRWTIGLWIFFFYCFFNIIKIFMYIWILW